MPEGDTLYRIAEVMRRTLAGDQVVAARGRPGGARLDRVVGSRVTGVSTRGKHLLIEFDDGLTLHTHLQMTGSWHRYRPGERWRAPAAGAVAVIETGRAVAVVVPDLADPTDRAERTQLLELTRSLGKAQTIIAALLAERGDGEALRDLPEVRDVRV